MTKREREKLRQAIKYLTDEEPGYFHEAMMILLKLAKQPKRALVAPAPVEETTK